MCEEPHLLFLLLSFCLGPSVNPGRLRVPCGRPFSFYICFSISFLTFPPYGPFLFLCVAVLLVTVRTWSFPGTNPRLPPQLGFGVSHIHRRSSTGSIRPEVPRPQAPLVIVALTPRAFSPLFFFLSFTAPDLFVWTLRVFRLLPSIPHPVPPLAVPRALSRPYFLASVLAPPTLAFVLGRVPMRLCLGALGLVIAGFLSQFLPLLYIHRFLTFVRSGMLLCSVHTDSFSFFTRSSIRVLFP